MGSSLNEGPFEVFFVFITVPYHTGDLKIKKGYPNLENDPHGSQCVALLLRFVFNRLMCIELN